MLDPKTREYFLKQSPASLVDLIEGYALKLEAAHRRMKASRRRMGAWNIDGSADYAGAQDCIDLRKRKDLDR